VLTITQVILGSISRKMVYCTELGRILFAEYSGGFDDKVYLDLKQRIKVENSIYVASFFNVILVLSPKSGRCNAGMK
jgi:hypothetical protein